MTPDEIDALDAGLEMDALIAEKVMGWRRFEKDEDAVGMDRPWFLCAYGYVMVTRPAFSAGGLRRSWSPSSNIADAWEVVEKLGLAVTPDGGEWYACKPNGVQHKLSANGPLMIHFNSGSTAWGKTAPLAIARCALKAVMG